MTIGFPPVIDEGEPNEVCPVTPFFNFVTCMVGTNYCIPPTLPNQIILLCQHSPPPTPVTPNPQIGVWFLNGVQISDDEGTANPEAPSAITLTQQGRRLAIPSPAMAPLGNYTCMLTNIAGFDVSTTIISTCGELSSFNNFFTTGSYTHSSTPRTSTSKKRRSFYNSDWVYSTLFDHTSDYHPMRVTIRVSCHHVQLD